METISFEPGVEEERSNGWRKSKGIIDCACGDSYMRTSFNYATQEYCATCHHHHPRLFQTAVHRTI